MWKSIRSYVITVFGLLLLLTACKNEPKEIIKTAPISFAKEGELTLLKSQTDSIIAKLDIEIADSEYETQTGLMYRTKLEEKQGMLFIFPDSALHSFYMKNTQIALDLLFIDSEMQLVSFHENATPLNETGISSNVPVQYVLEINAGLIEKWGLEIGDRIEFKR